MRLRRLDLTRYGKFTDYSIDFGENVASTTDLHIIYGLNEAGKSTALAGYLDLLFGIDRDNTYGFLHKGKAMEIGACLEFDGSAQEFKRVKQQKNSLLNGQGQPINEAILSVPLAGLTRYDYRMMFSLNDQTLKDGGQAIIESKGNLGELLFSASTGLVSISTILESANVEAEEIYKKRARSTTIAVLKAKIDDLKSERKGIDTQASAYRLLTTELDQARGAYDEAMIEIGTSKARQDEIVRILRAHPEAAEYRRGLEKLAEYMNMPYPPDDWAEALPNLIVEEARLDTEVAGIEKREKKIREELEVLVVDERLLNLEADVQDLEELATRCATEEKDSPAKRDALSEWTRKIDLILAALGKSDIGDPKTLLIPAATIGTLRDLIAVKSGIDVTHETATTEFENAREHLEKEQRLKGALEDKGITIDVGIEAQLRSVLSRLRNGNLIAELRMEERDIGHKQQAFDDAVSLLHPWSGDGTALRQIFPPTRDRFDTWKSTLTVFESRRTQILDRRREFVDKQEDNTARISALREVSRIIDDDEARRVLHGREEAWAHHKLILDSETAALFETRMRETDVAAEARLSSAKELEELRSIATELAAIKTNVNQQDRLLGEIDEELDALRGEIRAEMPNEIVLRADAPIGAWLASAGQWTEKRTVALTAWKELSRSLRDIEEYKAALAEEQNPLTEHLSTVGVAVDGLDLAALMQATDSVLEEYDKLLASRKDANKRIGEFEEAMIKRKAAFDKAENTSKQWQRDWESALANTWFIDKQGSVGAVRELLDAIDGLPEALREKDGLQERIDSIESNRRSFTDQVKDLHEALGEALGDRNPFIGAKDIFDRHKNAKEKYEKRLERNQDLANLEVERDSLNGDIAGCEARRQEMTGLFAVETLADVRQALERCRKRDELAEKQDGYERQIVADMQTHSLADALTRLADVDLAALQSEQAELEKRLKNLDERAKELYADMSRAGDRLTAIGGDDTVARIEVRRRTLLLEIEDAALRYLRLKSGSIVAEHGLRAYRENHRSAMMSRASDAFRLITRGDYTGLATRPDKDREVLIGMTGEGGSKLAVEMSKGTQFQLYLALRLAGYEEFAAVRPTVPFIADDIMESFDEPRSEEVIRLFEKMSHVGQVIYLTHHRYICEIAAEVAPSAVIHEIT